MWWRHRTGPWPASAAVVISSEGVEGPYSHLEYSAAADGKEFLVEVRGVPFAGMTQETFDQALMNVLMVARPSRPAAQFTTRPTNPSLEPTYRLVLVFGPARNLARSRPADHPAVDEQALACDVGHVIGGERRDGPDQTPKHQTPNTNFK